MKVFFEIQDTLEHFLIAGEMEVEENEKYLHVAQKIAEQIKQLSENQQEDVSHNYLKVCRTQM